MQSLNRDILVAVVFAFIAFIVIVVFALVGFTSALEDGVVLLRNYGIALGVISIVFTRTATREDIDERNETALNIAFKLGIVNTIVALGMMIVQILML